MIYNARFTDGTPGRKEIDSVESRDDSAHNCAEYLMLERFCDPEDGNFPEDEGDCCADLTGGPTEWAGTVTFRGQTRRVAVTSVDA